MRERTERYMELMVVAAKRSAQMNQRTVDFSGAAVVKPESARLAVSIDMQKRSRGEVGLTTA